MKFRTLNILLVLTAILSLVFVPFTIQAQDEPDGCDAIDWIDELFTLTNYCNTTVPLSEITPGCRTRECIPAIRPEAIQMESVADASVWLADQSPVIALEINGEARAYPQAILVYHEIANDEIGGIPVAITYCPLCNSSIVFERNVNGDILEFAVTGLLRNSDLVMFDRETETWWQQFTGEGLVGDYAGDLLDIIPSQVIGFGQFAERYPDGQVLARTSGLGADAYGDIPDGYTNYNEPFLFSGEPDSRLPATAHVLAGVVGGVPIAYPFSTLDDDFVVNDTIGDEAIVVIWQAGTVAMMDNQVIDNSVDIGTAAMFSRVIDGQTLTFAYDTASDTIIDNETGSVWNLFGEAISGELAGTTLEQIVAAPHFWFAWAAFYPDTLIYGME